MTPSASVSISASASVTQSTSLTPTVTLSTSITASGTATPSATASSSPSASVTASHTPSDAMTPSPSPTASASASQLVLPSPSSSSSSSSSSPSPSSSAAPSAGNSTAAPSIRLNPTAPSFEADELGAGFDVAVFADNLPQLPAVIVCHTSDPSEAQLVPGSSSVSVTLGHASTTAAGTVRVVGVADNDPLDVTTVNQLRCTHAPSGTTAELSFVCRNAARPLVSSVIVTTVVDASTPPVAVAAAAAGGTANPEFSIALTGGANQTIVLASNASLPEGVAFPSSTVTMALQGAAAVTVAATVSADGRNVSVAAPHLADVCGHDAECMARGAYVNVTVSVPAAPPVASPVHGSVPGATTFGGLFFTRTCAGYPVDPAVCLTVATAGACALGVEPLCTPCPDNGLCPGGWRLRPVRGHWVADETQTAAPEPCLPPATARCVGWNTTVAAVQCGAGFEGPSCRGCAAGWYPDSVDGCRPCPSSTQGTHGTSSIRTIVTRWTAFAIGAALVFVLVFLSVLLLQRGRNSSVSAGMFRARDFVMWAALCLQLVAQVGQQAVRLPRPLRELYRAVQLSLLDSATVLHPRCTVSDPFLFPTAHLGATVLLGALAVVLTVRVLGCGCGCRRSRRRKGNIFDPPPPPPPDPAPSADTHRTAPSSASKTLRWVVALCVLLYPLTCRTAVNMLWCVTPPATYLRPDPSPLLATLPYYTCFGSNHLVAGSLALASAAVYLLGFPVLVVVVLRRCLWAALLQQQPKDANPLQRAPRVPIRAHAFQAFIAGDFVPAAVLRARSLQFAVHVAFAVTNTVWPLVTATHTAVKLAVQSTCVVALACVLVVPHPVYVPRKRWRQAVKLCSLVVVQLAVVANAMNAGVVDGRATSSAAVAVADGLNWAVFGALCVLLLVLLVAFYWDLATGVSCCPGSGKTELLAQRFGNDALVYQNPMQAAQHGGPTRAPDASAKVAPQSHGGSPTRNPLLSRSALAHSSRRIGHVPVQIKSDGPR